MLSSLENSVKSVGVSQIGNSLTISTDSQAAFQLGERIFGGRALGIVKHPLLLEVEVPIVSNDLCDEAYGCQRITDAMLCAGAVGWGKDACQGDSVGPLVVDRKLAEIVSWGRGCVRPDFPGGYASGAYLKKFFEETVLKN